MVLQKKVSWFSQLLIKTQQNSNKQTKEKQQQQQQQQQPRKSTNKQYKDKNEQSSEFVMLFSLTPGIYNSLIIY